MLSLSTFVSFGGAMVLQIFAGILADIDVRYTYLTNAVPVIALVLIIAFLKNPDPDEAIPEKTRSGGLSARVIGVSIVLALASLFIMPALFMFSFLVQKISASVTVSSTVQFFYTIGCMIGGLTFMIFYRFTRRFSIGVSLILAALGIGGLIIASNLPMFYTTMLIAGIEYSSLIPAVLMIVSQVTEPRMIPFATSVVYTSMNLMGFFATPFIGFFAGFGDPVTFPIVTGMVFMTITGIVMFIINPYPKFSSVGTQTEFTNSGGNK
jgi:MFS family permease